MLITLSSSPYLQELLLSDTQVEEDLVTSIVDNFQNLVTLDISGSEGVTQHCIENDISRCTTLTDLVFIHINCLCELTQQQRISLDVA